MLPRQLRRSIVTPRPHPFGKFALLVKSFHSYKETDGDKGGISSPYWPPKEAVDAIWLSERKKAFTFQGKSDEDGSHEPTLALATRNNKRLAFFNHEEVVELIRVAPRLSSYLDLWTQKCEEFKERAGKATVSTRMADEDMRFMD